MPLPDDSLHNVETAHVLFMDIVGFTRRSLFDQADTLCAFRDAIQQSSAFQRAAQAQSLLCLPTGDGAALVFFRNPVAPLRCALETAHILRTVPVPLRMGLHSGLICHVPDINGRQNVSGEGINTAQRVMDCGEAGHILASQAVASLLLGLEGGDTYMRDWGEQTVKHDQKVRVYNLLMDGLGNPSLPAQRPSAAIASPPDAFSERQSDRVQMAPHRQGCWVTPELLEIGDFEAEWHDSRSLEYIVKTTPHLIDTGFQLGETLIDFLIDPR